MSIQRILRKYLYLKYEDFGEIAIMALLYEQNQEFDETKFKEENVIFFYINIKKDLDFMLNERKRHCKNRKEKKENENKK